MTEETQIHSPITTDNSPPNSTPGGEVGLASLVERQLARYINADRQVLPASGLYDRVMNEVERPLLRLVLNLVNGNKIQAARLLGVNRNTLLKKLRFHGLENTQKTSRRDSEAA